MNRKHILDEISRTASKNGGAPLGRRAFAQETGIKESDWRGVFWARWNDALAEAGFGPNKRVEAREDDNMLECMARLAIELGRIPVKSEVVLKRRSDPTFPSEKTYSRFGKKPELIAALRRYCEGKSEFTSLLPMLEASNGSEQEEQQELDDSSEPAIGFIYMLKAGRYFKVGRSNEFGRRSRELAIQLPERAETVHVIRTDDPAGIEAYWHKRFESKRLNGEWFSLSAVDVKADLPGDFRTS